MVYFFRGFFLPIYKQCFYIFLFYFICLTFTYASLSSPVAYCDKTSRCERAKLRFLCGLVTIFLFRWVLSVGTYCSTSLLLNSLSNSFIPSWSCSSFSLLELPSFFCSTNDVSVGSDQTQCWPLFLSLKIGSTILNHSESSVKANTELDFSY